MKIKTSGDFEFIGSGRHRMLKMSGDLQRTFANVNQFVTSLSGNSNRSLAMPVDKMGFYASVTERTITVRSGEYRYNDPLGSTAFTGDLTISNIGENMNGYLYVAFECEDEPHVAGGSEVSQLALYVTNSGAYYFEWDIDGHPAQAPTGNVVLAYADDVNQGVGFFRKTIAAVTTDGDGIPSVRQIHLGPIYIPYVERFMSEISGSEG